MNCCSEEIKKLNSDLRNLKHSVSSEIELEKVRYDLVALLLSLLNTNSHYINLKNQIENVVGDLFKSADINSDGELCFYKNANKTGLICSVKLLKDKDIYISSGEFKTGQLILTYNDSALNPIIIDFPQLVTNITFNNNTFTVSYTKGKNSTFQLPADVHVASGSLNSSNQLVLTLTNGLTLNPIDLSNLILEVPLTPGYYFSASTYNNNESFGSHGYDIEYIGVDLIKYPDNQTNHRYVYEVENKTSYRFVDEYKFPDANTIYIVSSSYRDIKINNSSPIPYPIGKVAYFIPKSKNGNNSLEWGLREIGALNSTALTDSGESELTCTDPTYITTYKNCFLELKNSNDEYVTIADPLNPVEGSEDEDFLRIYNELVENNLIIRNFILPDSDPAYTLDKFSNKYTRLWKISNDDFNSCFTNNVFNIKTFIQKVYSVKIHANPVNIGEAVRFSAIYRHKIPLDNLYVYDGSFPNNKYENLKWTKSNDLSILVKPSSDETDANNVSYIHLFKYGNWTNYGLLVFIWRYLLMTFLSSDIGLEKDVTNPVYNTYKEDVGWTTEYGDWKLICKGSNIMFTISQNRINLNSDGTHFNNNLTIDFDFLFRTTKIYGQIGITMLDYHLQGLKAVYFNKGGQIENSVYKYDLLLPNILINSLLGVYSAYSNGEYVTYELSTPGVLQGQGGLDDYEGATPGSGNEPGSGGNIGQN